MRNFLAWLYWYCKAVRTPYKYELPQNGFEGKLPLSLSHTIIPEEYVNHTLEEDKKHYSKFIIK